MKVKYKGRNVEAVEIDALTTDENWNIFQLSDGNVLRYKDVLVDICKVVGETNEDGSPVYLFRTSRVIRIN